MKNAFSRPVRGRPWRPGVALAFALLLSHPGGAVARAEEYHDNVVIVLDASGSMKDLMPGGQVAKIAAAKAALKTVLQHVPTNTYIGLLVFSARNVRDPWIYPLGPRRDDDLLRAIDLPDPFGNTPLGHYLKVGADRLLQERAKQFGYGSYRLLIVTDGEAQDQNLVDRFAPDVLARGITMDVIGVAMSQDHTLARKAHSYRRANDPASLQRAVAEVLAEVSKPKNDLAQADAFALLAPIPDAIALAALQALSTSGNHPIGESPAVTKRGPGPSAQAPASPPPNTPPPRNPPSSPAGHHPRGGFSGSVLWLIALFAVITVLRRLFRAFRR